MNGKRLKYLLFALLCCIFAAGVVLGCTLDAQHRRTVCCTGLEVKFADSLKFVSEDDVRGWLEKGCGTWVGVQIDSLKLHEMEETVSSGSAVKDCEAWVTGDGTLHLRIRQREPAVRFESGSGGFYADDRGYIFPLRDGYSVDVRTVGGELPLGRYSGYKGEARTPEEREWIAGVLQTLRAIDGSKAYGDRVQSITADGRGELTLRLDCSERFLFGKPCDAGEKLSLMDKFFSHIQPSKGEGYYKTVNLKYKGQIICRRKDT